MLVGPVLLRRLSNDGVELLPTTLEKTDCASTIEGWKRPGNISTKMSVIAIDQYVEEQSFTHVIAESRYFPGYERLGLSQCSPSSEQLREPGDTTRYSI